MIFGAIWSSGLRKIVRVDGNMNSSSYIDILKSHILPLMQDDQVLQQDNAPCHKSNEVKNFMEKFGVAVVPDWPARSPDLNIIENCWGVLKQRLERYQCATLDDLWLKTEKEFFEIPDSFIQKLFESLPRRVESVLQARGYPIGY